jgi:opacity protein-like surface antigen
VYKKILCLLSLTFIASICSAQPEPVATPPPAPPQYGWKNSLVTGLTLTQVSFTDWAQGGENALAYSFTADGKSEDDEISTNWTNTYKFAFGQTRLGSQGIRKTDDIIDLSTVFTYKLGTYINPYVSGNLKTQFAHGFTYDASGTGTQVSKFFDPAYLMQSAGVGYDPVKEVKTRLGIGLREIITQDFNQYASDPATHEIVKTRIDGGMESVTAVNWPIDTNMLLTSQLELFSPFKTMDEIVVRGGINLTAKVNKYITTVVSAQFINEKRISPKTQLKEAISLGLSYTLF